MSEPVALIWCPDSQDFVPVREGDTWTHLAYGAASMTRTFTGSDGVEYEWVTTDGMSYTVKAVTPKVTINGQPLNQAKDADWLFWNPPTPPPPPKEAAKAKCEYEWSHETVHYVGFTEIYDYCKKCDAKKIDGKWVKNE